MNELDDAASRDLAGLPVAAALGPGELAGAASSRRASGGLPLRQAARRDFYTEEDLRWLGRQMLEAKGPDAPYWRHGLNALSDLAMQLYPEGFPVSDATLSKLTIEDAFPPHAEKREAIIDLAEIFHDEVVGEVQGAAILKRLDSWIGHYQQTGCGAMEKWIRAWRAYFLTYIAPKDLIFQELS